MAVSTHGEFLACDWGTTNLRTWVIGDKGRVLRSNTFPYGVSLLKPGEARQKFYADIRPNMRANALPALLCGMIGSNLGWQTVPYQCCPIDLGTLATSLAQMENDPGVWIVPGVRGRGISGAPELMRGEETQILGWVAQDSTRGIGRIVLCHPGTHAKWVIVEDGRIMRFITAMTGELFQLLRTHSVLQSYAETNDETAFDEGVVAAFDGNALAARLFTARTRVVTGMRPEKTSASYLSGLLIGAEIASVPKLLGLGVLENIHLLGDPVLCGWYKRALVQGSVSATIHNGEDAVIAGLSKMRAMADP
jgi:2-dehydro-3-deoxygalactonokinase